MKPLHCILLCLLCTPVPAPSAELVLERQAHADRLEGFWLGQCIANWTGLVTEMDKIGGEGPHGRFYTRDDWGGPDQPAIWGGGQPSPLSPTIDFVFCDPDSIWGADDDTDIEYLYQHLLGKLPATGDPALNPHTDMIDAQLTTEIFGLFAPGRPDVALRMARLPILTTARGDARLAAEFYVILHALAATVDDGATPREQILGLADRARRHLPEGSTPAAMFDLVRARYQAGLAWEEVRDELYHRYQIRQEDGYDIHRTRRGFPRDGLDNFPDMARRGMEIIDRVVAAEMGGAVDLERDLWVIPLADPAAPD